MCHQFLLIKELMIFLQYSGQNLAQSEFLSFLVLQMKLRWKLLLSGPLFTVSGNSVFLHDRGNIQTLMHWSVYKTRAQETALSLAAVFHLCTQLPTVWQGGGLGGQLPTFNRSSHFSFVVLGKTGNCARIQSVCVGHHELSISQQLA